MINSSKYSKKDHLLNIVLVLFFILPQNMVLYLFVPVAMLLMYDRRKQTVQRMGTVIIAIVVSLSLSLLINLAMPWLTVKSFLSFIKLILLFACFGRLKSVNIIKDYLIFTLVYLAIFQFAYQLSIPGIDSLMSTIYPIDEEAMEQYAFRESMTFSDIGGYNSRLGGIYYNSNICAFFFEALLILFVNEKKQFKRTTYIASLVLIIACIISAGSRTSLLVLIGIALFSFSESGVSTKISAIILSVIFFLFFYYFGSEFRLFQVGDGLNDSFSQKLSLLLNYLDNQPNALRLLWGSFTTACLPYMFGSGAFPGTDFDMGDFIVSYGFVSFILLVIFLWIGWSTLNKSYKRTLVILIWCFSNTVFMSYRASAVFMLIFSIYCYKSLLERKVIK